MQNPAKSQSLVVPQWSILKAILFNSFFNDLDDEMTFLMTWQGCRWQKTERSGWYIRVLYCHLKRPQGSEEVSRQVPHKVQQVKCKILHLGRNKCIQQYTLEPTGWKTDWQESSESPGGQEVDHGPAICFFSKEVLQCPGMCKVKHWQQAKEVIPPFHPLLVRYIWSTRSCSELKKDMDILGWVHERPWGWFRYRSIWLTRTGWETWDCSA